jgi:hypothetical protein
MTKNQLLNISKWLFIWATIFFGLSFALMAVNITPYMNLTSIGGWVMTVAGWIFYGIVKIKSL